MEIQSNAALKLCGRPGDSTAGSLVGGLLGRSKSKTKMAADLLGDAGTAARRRGISSTSDRRVDAARNKVERLVVHPKRTHVKVTHLALAWVPVS